MLSFPIHPPLKNIRDNEFNTLAVRRKANEDAYKVEKQREDTLAELARRRIELLRRQIELDGGRQKVSRERYQELKEAENELSDIQEDAAGKQNELITNRYQLAKEGQDAEKERAEKVAEANRAQLQVAIGLLDVQLQTVRKNSDEELSILRKKLALQYQLELAAKGLTVGQKRLADAKYEAEKVKLETDAARARAVEVLQIEVQGIAARLAAVARGGAEELALQQQQIETQRTQQLRAIDRTLSDEAQAAQRRAINAAADRQQDDLLYADKLRKLDTFQQQQRNQLETDRARGVVDDKQYQDLLYQQQVAALTARLALAKKFGQDTTDLQQQLDDAEIGRLQQVGERERAQYQQRVELAKAFGAQVGEVFAATLTEQGKTLESFVGEVLVLILDMLEKQMIAQVSAATLTATAGSLASPESIATAGVAGLAKAVILTAAITAAFGVAKAAIRAGTSQPSGTKFAEGGVVYGPSHAQGGVQLYHRSGAHLGEMEGEEIILNKNVYRSPALRQIASAINVVAGGRAFATQISTGLSLRPHYAQGGIVRPGMGYDAGFAEYLQGLRQPGITPQAPPIDYNQLGAAVAAHLNPGMEQAFIAAVQGLPTPVVEVLEINRAQKSLTVAEQKADI